AAGTRFGRIAAGPGARCPCRSAHAARWGAARGIAHASVGGAAGIAAAGRTVPLHGTGIRCLACLRALARALAGRSQHFPLAGDLAVEITERLVEGALGVVAAGTRAARPP